MISKKEAGERIEEAFKAICSEEGFQNWLVLRTSASMSRFSLNNQLLIWCQAPDARYLKTFKGWLNLDRCAVKGAKAIRVLRPVLKTVEAEETDPTTGAKVIRKRQVLLGFSELCEFDVTQTDGAPYEVPEYNLDGDDLAKYLDALVAHATSLETVDRVEFKGCEPAKGYFQPSAKLIVVDPSLPVNEQVKVLVHETAHAYGIGYDNFTPDEAEVIVELAAAIVQLQLGVTDLKASAGYLAAWSAGEVEKVRARLNEADKIARKIFAAIQPVEVEEEVKQAA